jgi:hypothetical protein
VTTPWSSEGVAVVCPKDVRHAAEEEVQDPEDECGPQIQREHHVLCAEQDCAGCLGVHSLATGTAEPR